MASKQVQTYARHEVFRAIARGDLLRCPCEVCGCETVEAHHEDYDRPLDVRWLCRLHHLRRHAAMRREVDPTWDIFGDELSDTRQAERERTRKAERARRAAA